MQDILYDGHETVVVYISVSVTGLVINQAEFVAKFLSAASLPKIARFAAEFSSVENLPEKFRLPSLQVNHLQIIHQNQHCDELPVVLFQRMK